MPKRNLAWILVVALIALLFWRMPQTIAGRDALFSAFGPLVDVRAQILKRSAETVDDTRLSQAATEAGIEAMLKELNDPYAAYFDKNQLPEFRKQTEGVFGGIGVDVSLAPDGIRILGRMRNSPAAAAGLEIGDVIVQIDDEVTRKLGLVESVSRLSGTPDSFVRLRVRRTDGSERDVRIRRTLIEVNPVRGWARQPDGGWRYDISDEPRLAYVRLIKFMPEAARQLDAVVEPLLASGVRGLILDLRENTGGLLRVAIDVADRFLDTGLIVATRGPRSDAKEWFAQRDDTYPALPLVILVNGQTASAAEIVAGALRDHRRALIIGERTYGKGCVQELIPLEDRDSAIKLTTGYYYLPSGRCLHRRPGKRATDDWGVPPDVPVVLDAAARDRWIEAWYRAGMQPRVEERPGEDQPGKAPEGDAATTRPTTLTDPAETRRALLQDDPQLRRAIEVLSRIIQPRAGASDPVAKN